ncbi:hypothetical protein L596_011926 [Steinernema carpocapsae]|uniref:Nuclear receptor domain-containing protein n=2 Tax=Steinernema carpocapsae TaxID=34508 RepID=A0A4U5NVK4_STECR|nr:hypothetical protein L596_011926 [Steinernema carpocapsae]
MSRDKIVTHTHFLTPNTEIANSPLNTHRRLPTTSRPPFIDRFACENGELDELGQCGPIFTRLLSPVLIFIMPQTCVVCGAKSHGIHFQVNACRACAAFFRRSVESGKKYKCRRASYNCDVSKDAFQQCRRCRFQKCKQVGMTMKGNRKVRLNDEEEKALEEEKQSSSVCSVDSNLTHVEEGHFENHRHKCDTHALKRKVLSVLDQNEPSTSFSNNLTLTLTDALHEIYPMKAPESIVIGKAIDQLQMVKFYFEDLIITAKWMMRCEEYAKLPSIDKWLIYSKFWQYYKCLEKCARTTELLGNDNPNLLLLSHDVAMDLHDVSRGSRK